jgi:predicted CXXCH cytochrome family protein
MPRETGKQRRSRIELGYYHRPDALARRRRRIVLAVVGLALLWLVLAPFWPRGRPAPRLLQWKQLASHGELARAHAAWAARCEACHIPWTPIDGSRWSPLRPANRASDQLCQSCHGVGPHTLGEAPEQADACAECHRDHRGRDASLVRVEDAVCTSCHRDLTAHRGSSPDHAVTADRITAFPARHPEFPTTDDPGRLVFDHLRHLEARRVIGPDGRESRIQLDCQSCHQPDAAGAYMKPISYESHCRSCHPLTYDPREPSLAVRHGQQPADVIADLRAHFSAQVLQGDPAASLARPRPRPLPGRAEGLEPTPAPEVIHDRVSAAVRALFVNAPAQQAGQPPADRRGCLLCHTLETPLEPGDAADPDAIARSRIVPPSLRVLWFEKARFDHSAHRLVSCAACHQRVEKSATSADVLLPDRAVCAQCHAPPGSAPDGATLGGAGFDCTECHRYHQRTGTATLPRRDVQGFLNASAAVTP